MNKSFKSSDLANVTLAFYKLKEFIKKSDHPLSHVKLLYNVQSKKCYIEGSLSQENYKNELANDIVDSINYTFQKIITTYVTSYKKCFLTKIAMDVDVDLLGLSFPSLNIACQFSLNPADYNLSEDKLISKILLQTIENEENGSFEQAATSVEFFLKRRKVRTMTIFTNFGLDKSDNSFSKQWMSNLLNFIRGYVKEGNGSNFEVKFSLTNRKELKAIYATLFSSVNYSSRNLKIFPIIISEIEWLGYQLNLGVESIGMKRVKNDCYKILFNMQPKKVSQRIYDLNSVDTIRIWHNLFQKIINSSGIKHIPSLWKIYFDASVENIKNEITLKKVDIRLHKNIDKKLSTKEIKHILDNLNRDGIVSDVRVTRQAETIKSIDVTSSTVPIDITNTNLAMQLSNSTYQQDNEVIYHCAIADDKLFVFQIIYRDQVE